LNYCAKAQDLDLIFLKRKLLFSEDIKLIIRVSKDIHNVRKALYFKYKDKKHFKIY